MYRTEEELADESEERRYKARRTYRSQDTENRFRYLLRHYVYLAHCRSRGGAFRYTGCAFYGYHPGGGHSSSPTTPDTAGQEYLPETDGRGRRLPSTYDNDGWLDILFINGKDWAPRGSSHCPCASIATTNGTFADVTAGSGSASRCTAWASPSATTTTMAATTICDRAGGRPPLP